MGTVAGDDLPLNAGRWPFSRGSVGLGSLSFRLPRRHPPAAALPGGAAVHANDFLAIGVGIAVLACCLVIHAFFMFRVLHAQLAYRRRHPEALGMRLVVPSILVAVLLIVVSCFIQIVLWSVVLWIFGEFDTPRDAMHFSGTTFTTLGTTKHVLVPPYRVFEPIEAMNGILAAGLNTAILFAIIANVGRRQGGLGEFFE